MIFLTNVSVFVSIVFACSLSFRETCILCHPSVIRNHPVPSIMTLMVLSQLTSMSKPFVDCLQHTGSRLLMLIMVDCSSLGPFICVSVVTGGWKTETVWDNLLFSFSRIPTSNVFRRRTSYFDSPPPISHLCLPVYLWYIMLYYVMKWNIKIKWSVSFLTLFI